MIMYEAIIYGYMFMLVWQLAWLVLLPINHRLLSSFWKAWYIAPHTGVIHIFTITALTEETQSVKI